MSYTITFPKLAFMNFSAHFKYLKNVKVWAAFYRGVIVLRLAKRK